MEFTLERTQVVPRPLEETFTFFADPYNLESITPPWLHFQVLEAPRQLEEGSTLRYRLRLLGVPILWETEIAARWYPPRAFTDVQTLGPYPLWEHTHRFTAVENGTEIFDHVRYRVPGGPFAPLVQRFFVAPRLDAIFDYRVSKLDELLRPDG